MVGAEAQQPDARPRPGPAHETPPEGTWAIAQRLGTWLEATTGARQRSHAPVCHRASQRPYRQMGMQRRCYADTVNGISFPAPTGRG